MPQLACWPVVAISVLCALPARAAAQDGSSRIDVSGSFTTTTFDSAGGWRRASGAAAVVDVPLNRSLSLTTRVVVFPQRELTEFRIQGGRTLETVVGVRGVLLDGRRFALESEMAAGAIRFSRTNTGITLNAPLPTGAATHFDLSLGVGLAFHLTRQVDLIAESTSVVYPFAGASVVTGQNAHAELIAFLPSWVASLPEVSVGTRLRFGDAPRRADDPVGHRAGRWTIGGGVVSAVAAPVAGSPELDYPMGPGAFVTYQASDLVDLDGAVSTERHTNGVGSPFEGGRITNAMGGVRIGVRTARTGFFFKVRAGALSNSRTLQALNTSPASVTVHRSTVPITEVGGVLEVYATRHLLWRLDGSIARVWFSDTSVVVDGVTVPNPLPPTTPTIRLSTGVGWRF